MYPYVTKSVGNLKNKTKYLFLLQFKVGFIIVFTYV